MKLIIAIVNSDNLIGSRSFTEGGYFVTKLSTTGDFEKGNTTFFVELMMIK
ncbi:MAG: cyclic-di-AMP receptor [Streptococcus sp.]